MQNMNPAPTVREVFDTFGENLGRFFEFDYDHLHPRKWDQNCLYLSENTFKGFTGKDQGEVFRSNEGNFLFRTYFSTRRDAETGAYQPRSIRLDAIRLDTVMVTNGPHGKVRLFPNVPPNYKAVAVATAA